MMKNFKKGFTLIELLVVIAIIGILAAIALTSLGSARDKARNSSAQGSLSSARASAEIFFDDNNSYTGMCDAGEEVARLVAAAADQTGGTPNCVDTVNSGASYYISLDLLNDPNEFCVDSSGFAGKQDASTAGAPGPNGLCQ